MKTPLLLLASCLLLLVAVVISTPVDTSNLETARQAPGAGNPPAASTEDDDDDDDDDDIDLDITDDDDDDDDDDEDDAEDDDDDDEDFFERFFEDILGDDDDDDDDDDTPQKPAATPASSPVAAATQQRPIAPAVSASVDYPSLDYNTAPGETADTADPSAAPLAAYDEGVPEEQAAGLASDDVAEPAAALDASTPDLVQKPSDVAAAASTDDDEDDDDDDDDEELDVTLDDDDDDDDEDEDDEDDEDDDDDDDDDLSDVVGDDVIEAKRSRALENNPTSMYITKYNRFVDNILERINRILRKNYDPVNVRLHTNNENKGSGKNSGHKKNKNRRRRPGRRPHHTSPVARATTEVVEATMNESLAAISAQLTEALQGTTLQEMNDTLTTTITPTTKRSSGAYSRAQPQNNKNKKNKNNSTKNRPNAKATLYGLSTMKREGDVTVNMMSSHTTVRTKFTVGPLILRVEKEFGRGAKKDIRSATATTTEMTGKMNLRVMHGGAATLHSIRVMQPKQVRVESSDDHDKTREYVWKRSSHIARVVSQKLTNATKSMLQPPPMLANGVFA